MEKNFQDYELEEVFKRIVGEYTKRYMAVSKPKAILIGGQPGVGKSGMLRVLNKDNNFIFINGDEYRELHPRYKEFENEFGENSTKYTNEWASALIKKVLDELYEKKYNLIIEGTLRTFEVPKRQAEISKDFGYDVELCVLVVKPEISYLSTLLRYEKMLANGQISRMSPKEVQEEAAKNICENLNELYKLNLFENIRLLNREDEELYNMKKTPKINPATVLENEFTREWKKNEIEKYVSDYQNLIKILKDRKAPKEKIEEAEIEKNKFSPLKKFEINFPTKYDLTLEVEVLRELIWEVKAKIYRLLKEKGKNKDLEEINSKLADYLVVLSSFAYEKILEIKKECQNFLKDRCVWAEGNLLLMDYHDNEWGEIVHDDKKLYEYLFLEAMQAGLSWLIVLKKREFFREAFSNFDYKKIAKYTEDDIEVLMQNENIIRSRKKIEAMIKNAKAFMEIQKSYGSFDKYIWSFTDNKTIFIDRKDEEKIAKNELSDKISKDLKKRGFLFLGSVTVYSFMQAIGMVNDHDSFCFKR